MKAIIEIEKSFDDSSAFEKDVVSGDFEEFFRNEGIYLDRCADIIRQHPEHKNDGFTVTYTVRVNC